MDGIFQCTATKGLQSWFNRIKDVPACWYSTLSWEQWMEQQSGKKTMVHHLLQFHNSGSPHTLDWKKTLIITLNLGVANFNATYISTWLPEMLAKVLMSTLIIGLDMVETCYTSESACWGQTSNPRRFGRPLTTLVSPDLTLGSKYLPT